MGARPRGFFDRRWTRYLGQKAGVAAGLSRAPRRPRAVPDTATMPIERRLAEAAALLARAWRDRSTLPGLPHALPDEPRPQTREEAYAIQDEMSRLLGLGIAGWKVGAATPGIMREKNLDGPIPGPIYQPCLRHSPAEFAGEDFPRSNLESEFAFRLLEDLPHRDRPYEADQLARISVLHAAFDVVSSRYRASPGPFSEIADSGNSGGAVIGPELRDWSKLNLCEVPVRLRVNGGPEVMNYSGEWRRDPLDVFTWLANTLRERKIGGKITLSAGAFVLTGSVTEPRRLPPGSSAVAEFEGMGEVRVRISEAVFTSTEPG